MNRHNDFKNTIFIAAYRSFSVRYLLYSDIFTYLQKKPVRIVILLRDSGIQYYKDKICHPNVIIEPFQYKKAYYYWKKHSFSGVFVRIRRFLYAKENGARNNTLNVQLQAYKKVKNIRQFLNNAFDKLILFFLEKSHFLRKVFLYVESWLFDGKFYNDLFQKYKPILLISTSVGHNCDPYIMRAAKRFNCKNLSVVHSWDNSTTKGYKGIEPDNVVVWHEHMRDELLSFHDISKDKMFVGGIAHWDLYWRHLDKPIDREKFCKEYGLSNVRKILFFGMSGPKQFRDTFDTIEEILDRAKRGKFTHSVQLLVRVHPTYLLVNENKDENEVPSYVLRIKSIEKKYGDTVKFNWPDMPMIGDDVDMPLRDMESLAEILKHSDVMITQFSSLIIEAAIFDLPIVNAAVGKYRDTEYSAFSFSNYTHLKRILETGACQTATNMEELCFYINDYLKDRSKDREHRKALVDQECNVNRGCAGKAIGKYINGLLAEV